MDFYESGKEVARDLLGNFQRQTVKRILAWISRFISEEVSKAVLAARKASLIMADPSGNGTYLTQSSVVSC